MRRNLYCFKSNVFIATKSLCRFQNLLDGNWICNKLIKNGDEIKAKDDFELLAINGSGYTLTRNKIEEQGLLHFLPYSKITGINFYKMEKDLLIEIIRGIYKQENDQLVICLNYISDKRPGEFLSTPENQCVLAYYKKTV